MATQKGSGFRYTPPGGSLTEHAARLRARDGLLANVQTRYRHVALDQRTIDVVTIAGGADEVEATIRFDHAPDALRTMLVHGANGVVLTYYPDLAGATAYPLALMSFGDVVEIRADRDRFVGFAEFECVVRLRRIDGGSLDGLFT